MTAEDRIRTFRWLFYISLFQLVACLALPAILFPAPVRLSIELLVALTVGLLFALYFLGINIYGAFVDKKRRPVYVALTVLMSVWAIWAAISWRFIEHMRYLN